MCNECSEEFCSGTCREFQYDAYQRLTVHAEKEKDPAAAVGGILGGEDGAGKKKKGKKKRSGGGGTKKKRNVSRMPVMGGRRKAEATGRRRRTKFGSFNPVKCSNRVISFPMFLNLLEILIIKHM